MTSNLGAEKMLDLLMEHQVWNEGKKDEKKKDEIKIEEKKDIYQDLKEKNLNKEVLKKFEAEQNSQTKIIENLLGFGTEETHPQIEEHNTTTNVVLSGNNIQEVH